MTASVVSNKPEIDGAFCKALRVIFVPCARDAADYGCAADRDANHC